MLEKVDKMSKQTLLSLFASAVFTIVITLVILLIVISRTMTVVNSGGIGAVAGGVSTSLFYFLFAAFPILLIGLFLVFSRVVFKRR